MIEILFHEQLYSHTVEMIDNPIIVAFVWLVLTDILTGIIKGQKAKHTPDMTNSTKGWYGIAKHILTVYLVLSIYPFFISIDLNYFAQLITIAWGYQYLVSILENLQAMHINVAWIRRIVDSVAKRYLAKAQDDYNPADFDKLTGKYKGRHKEDK